MVRNYTPKRKPAELEGQSKLLNELKSKVKPGTNIAALAREHGIPDSTLRRQLSGKGGKVGAGRPTLMGDKEQELAAWVQESTAKHLPPTAPQLRTQAARLARKYNVVFDTKDGMPSEEWMGSFMRRHSLSLRKTTPLDSVRQAAGSDVQALTTWFNKEYMM
jgi:transposase-like protein